MGALATGLIVIKNFKTEGNGYERGLLALSEFARRARFVGKYVIISGGGLPLPELGMVNLSDTGYLVSAVFPSGSVSEANNVEFETDLFP